MFISLPQKNGRKVAIDLRRITKIVYYGDDSADIFYEDEIIRIFDLVDWHGLIEKINEDLYGKKR